MACSCIVYGQAVSYRLTAESNGTSVVLYPQRSGAGVCGRVNYLNKSPRLGRTSWNINKSPRTMVSKSPGVSYTQEVHSTAASPGGCCGDEYQFSNYANWVVPGSVLVGRYPYHEPIYHTTYNQGEQILKIILEEGITTFVCAQGDLPPQSKLPYSGKNGYMPYKAAAELIKSSLSPPPSADLFKSDRNPTVDKWLPPKRRATSGTTSATPSYVLEFVQCPIDESKLSVADMSKYIGELKARLDKGEHMYIHDATGLAQSAILAACLLVAVHNLSADDALQRVQQAASTRSQAADAAFSPAAVDFIRQFVQAAK